MNLFNDAVWKQYQDPLFLHYESERYRNAKPFAHTVIDGLFNSTLLLHALGDFPEPDPGWWVYNNVLERKFAKNDISRLGTGIRNYLHLLMENQFVSFLEKLTGIEGLIVDHTLNGGGLHQIARGGKLDIHVDYNYHPVTKLDRRLNVILYMNLAWNPNWKGQLELWNPEMTECMERIDPSFNRLVIFSTTEQSNHGHPDPLECPEGVTRKSIAMYYYTHGRPVEERAEPHSTIFKRRPSDPTNEEIEELRRKRAIKRIT